MKIFLKRKHPHHLSLFNSRKSELKKKFISFGLKLVEVGGAEYFFQFHKNLQKKKKNEATNMLYLMKMHCTLFDNCFYIGGLQIF